MKAKYTKQIVLGRGNDGRQVRKRIRANSLTALNEEERKARNEYDRAHNPLKVTFGDYAVNWLDTFKAGRAPATIEMYRTKFVHCKDIWKKPLNKISRSEYQALIARVADRPNTADKLAKMLMQILRAAAADGIIAYPNWKFEKPKLIQPKKEALSESKMIDIFELPLDLRDRLFVRILGTYGLRPGEAFALSVDSIAPDGSILIDRAVKYDRNKPFIGPTKNGKVRQLPPSDAVAPLLALYLASFSGFYLFGNKEGELMLKSQSRAYCARISAEIGVKNLYQLRHTVATKLYYAPISAKLGSELLGNSENVFVNTYSHLDLSKENINVF